MIRRLSKEEFDRDKRELLAFFKKKFSDDGPDDIYIWNILSALRRLLEHKEET